jgi:N-succinyldiaminopimelate aminotransferase
MNPNLNQLEPYPFEKLAKLNQGIIPPADKTPIVMHIGEPKHKAPEFILKAIQDNRAGFSNYPVTQGSIELRQAIVDWLNKRFHIESNLLSAERNVLPVNGTREALFAFTQFIVDKSDDALVLMPNPFYKIYEGATHLAGAKPWYINIDKSTLLPDFSSVPTEIWQRCQLLFICSPGNPTGAVMTTKQMADLLELAHRYDFILASDECYAEIYLGEPPPGLLQAANEYNHKDFKRCMVFHSLSKRSSLPGMRSGFVAGDAELIEKFRLYRTYQGCAMALPIQAASTVAWQDEEHVQSNRELYKQKFAMAKEILGPLTEINLPEGAFYLWLKTPIDDLTFTQELFKKQNITIMPGSFLSREAHGINPGANYVRIALVSPLDECRDALNRIKILIQELKTNQVLK